MYDMYTPLLRRFLPCSSGLANALTLRVIAVHSSESFLKKPGYSGLFYALSASRS